MGEPGDGEPPIVEPAMASGTYPVAGRKVRWRVPARDRWVTPWPVAVRMPEPPSLQERRNRREGAGGAAPSATERIEAPCGCLVAESAGPQAAPARVRAPDRGRPAGFRDAVAASGIQAARGWTAGRAGGRAPHGGVGGHAMLWLLSENTQ